MGRQSDHQTFVYVYNSETGAHWVISRIVFKAPANVRAKYPKANGCVNYRGARQPVYKRDRWILEETEKPLRGGGPLVRLWPT